MLYAISALPLVQTSSNGLFKSSAEKNDGPGVVEEVISMAVHGTL